MGAAGFARLMVSRSINASLRANGSRECAPDDRLREAIHRARKSWIAFVAFAPRNDDLFRRLRPHLRPILHGGMWGGETRTPRPYQFFAQRAFLVSVLVTPAPDQLRHQHVSNVLEISRRDRKRNVQ